jgi:membrane carboxypeptidase/penicillin-binding protein
MVGGRNYSETQLNRASQAHRQPGSAFKPFLYTALLDRGYRLIDQVVCEPVSYPAGPGQPPYEPKDYGSANYHYAPLTMREAVKISDNVAAVRWCNEIGPATVVDYARRMGIFSPLQPYLPLTLGSFEVFPLELATAYCPLANGGFRVAPMAIRKVVAADGTVIEENAPRVETAVRPQAAYLMTSMLQTVMGPGGTGGHLGWILNRPSAGKTGTTSDSKDAWFVGFVPQVVCSAYVGYDDPQALWGPGGRLAGPIWAEFMRLALQGVPAVGFARPAGIVDISICSETHLRANPTCPAFTELFIEGTEPFEFCPIFHGLEPPGEPPGDTPGETPGETEPGITPEETGEDVPTWKEWFDQIREAWEREGEEWPDGP